MIIVVISKAERRKIARQCSHANYNIPTPHPFTTLSKIEILDSHTT